MDSIIHILYKMINDYEDIKQLCDTCKEYQEYKKILSIKLNKEYSLEFYRNFQFRSIILSKIIDPYEQLSIDLSDCDEVVDVKYLNNLRSLDLSCCKNIIDVRSLTNIHTLNLSNCNISDVSTLGNCHILFLDRCKNITNVSALGKVTKLSLSHCHNLSDVSALGNVYDLCLCNCHSLYNVSLLINNYILILRRCHNIDDFRSQTKIHTLDISYCRINDLSMFKDVRNLIFDRYYNY